MLNFIVSAGGGTAGLSPSAFLGFIAGIILAGFVADIVFRKFSIPSTLFLLVLGFLITNVLHIVSPDVALVIAPYFGTMAFAIILFEGGLALDIYALVKKLGIAFVFSTVVFLLSALAITLLWVAYGGNPYIGALIGVMLGGTSGAIVLPTIAKLKTSPEANIIAKFEAVLAEIYIVVGASVVLSVMKGGSVNVIQYLYNSIVHATIIGIIVGFVWLQAIKILIQNEVYYILTLGMLFGVYWLVEFLGGSGPLAAIILGMVISNAQTIVERILPILRINREKLDMLNFTLDEFTKQASVELSFVFSTFFFLILGMTVKIEYLLDVRILQGIFGIFLVLVAVRLVSTFVLYKMDRDIDFRDGLILFFMMPRGLVSAIVAFSIGAVLQDKSQMILAYAFGVIVISVVWMTVGTFATRLIFRKDAEETEGEKEEKPTGFWEKVMEAERDIVRRTKELVQNRKPPNRRKRRKKRKDKNGSK